MKFAAGDHARLKGSKTKVLVLGSPTPTGVVVVEYPGGYRTLEETALLEKIRPPKRIRDQKAASNVG